MLRKFRITLDERSYHVIVEEEEHGLAAPPATEGSIAAIPAPVAVSRPSAAISSATPSAATAGDVTAPLAGMIHSIDVRVGQTVQSGERVAVLEAMKMKTEVFTKVAGTVRRVAVKPQDGVDVGQILLSVG